MAPAPLKLRLLGCSTRMGQRANLDARTIRLDDADRAAIAALPKDQRFVRPPFAPNWDEKDV
jgi:hypothetical protein